MTLRSTQVAVRRRDREVAGCLASLRWCEKDQVLFSVDRARNYTRSTRSASTGSNIRNIDAATATPSCPPGTELRHNLVKSQLMWPTVGLDDSHWATFPLTFREVRHGRPVALTGSRCECWTPTLARSTSPPVFWGLKRGNWLIWGPMYHWTDRKIRVHATCCLAGFSPLWWLHLRSEQV